MRKSENINVMNRIIDSTNIINKSIENRSFKNKLYIRTMNSWTAVAYIIGLFVNYHPNINILVSLNNQTDYYVDYKNLHVYKSE